MFLRRERNSRGRIGSTANGDDWFDVDASTSQAYRAPALCAHRGLLLNSQLDSREATRRMGYRLDFVPTAEIMIGGGCIGGHRDRGARSSANLPIGTMVTLRNEVGEGGQTGPGRGNGLSFPIACRLTVLHPRPGVRSNSRVFVRRLEPS
jgi:hypothetical protein